MGVLTSAVILFSAITLAAGRPAVLLSVGDINIACGSGLWQAVSQMSMPSENRSEEALTGEYTEDGSIDLRGNPILRHNTGSWKACRFIVVYEIIERMTYYGVSTNLVLYLTNELHQGTVTASNNVTNWIGTVWLTPIIGACIADSFGRYWTFMLSSIIYFMGMCLLTLSVSVPSLKPPSCGAGTGDPNCINKASELQLGVFFLALYILAIGTGGTKPNISTIGADQFDDFHPKEHTHKLSFFNWWMFSIFFGILFGNTILVYIQDNVSWTVGYALPTLGLAIAVLVFVIGTPFYRHKLPVGNPMKKMAQVIVAAVRNWRANLPANTIELHELESEHYENNKTFQIHYTPTLRFLSKAAIKTGQSSGPWNLCTVTQVEEMKQMVLMIPILIATFIPSMMLSQVSTIFIKQGVTLRRNIGPNFSIPPASLAAFVTISMLSSVVIYDRYFVSFARRFTGNPRGISLLQRMGIGSAIIIVILLVASITERHRLSEARAHGVAESGGTVPITIFILLPQFLLAGIAETFIEVAKIEFFYDQAPEGMKSLGTSYAMTALGAGSFLNSILLKIAARVTIRDGGQTGWILNNLNKSHLDYYYLLLAILNALNLLFFLLVSRFYVYRAKYTEAKNQSLEELNE